MNDRISSIRCEVEVLRDNINEGLGWAALKAVGKLAGKAFTRPKIKKTVVGGFGKEHVIDQATREFSPKRTLATTVLAGGAAKKASNAYASGKPEREKKKQERDIKSTVEKTEKKRKATGPEARKKFNSPDVSRTAERPAQDWQ